MKKAHLLSTVAAALLLTVGAASAQDMKQDMKKDAAPAAQEKAPAEKIAPNMKAGEKNAETHKPAETTGQAPKASDADKTKATSDKGAMEKNASDKGALDKTLDKSPAAKSASDVKAKTNDSAQAPAATASEKSSTTGQGAAAGSAKLSTEQRTKITTIIKQQKVEKVEPAKLNATVSVGTRVPDSVHFYPLPREVIVIYPEWRGYDYILVGDQIVVINPRSHEIVAIIEA